jgi:hypothetical protein
MSDFRDYAHLFRVAALFGLGIPLFFVARAFSSSRTTSASPDTTAPARSTTRGRRRPSMQDRRRA